MRTVRNVFACLVHESRECVIDLVRNLHALDPASAILLYNGGQDASLLRGFPFGRHGAVVHPGPRPAEWGRLHEAALDCMRFALTSLPFDTLTIVDSDQLLTRSGYSAHVARCLDDRRGIGVLGNAPHVQPRNTQIAPAQVALAETELWRPFLRRFPDGEAKFVHWSFWPCTVFTADAARDLTELFAGDRHLRELLARTRMWATEEVLLPTLAALLGYEIAANPCSYDYVTYRTAHTLADVDDALGRPDVFWMHPVRRACDDPARRRIRERLGQYPRSPDRGIEPRATAPRAGSGLLLTVPILARMRGVEGWLEDAEADLLIATAARALASHPDAPTIVEVGSYCGRGTVVLGSVARIAAPGARVHAIDPHDGRIGSLDQGVILTPPSLEKFRRTLAAAGLTDMVEIVTRRCSELDWTVPVALLVIDGLHDYASVSCDFHCFEPHLVPGGYVAFHDYADYFPGVTGFVDELLQDGGFEMVEHVRSMIVLRRGDTP